MERPHPPRTPIEQDIVEAERAVAAFAGRNPDVTVTVLRFANALGPDIATSHSALLALPAVPSILGFDPRYQFIAEDDISGVLEHATRNDLPGVYNAAGDGVLALSEIASLLGKPLAPVLPPWGTGLAAAALRRAGLRIPPEMLQQLRYGRAIDNRRLKAAGLRVPLHDARDRAGVRRAPARPRPAAGRGEGYQYERDVEEFLRWSPAVRGDDRLGLERLSRDQLAELARALEALPRAGALGAARQPRRRRARCAPARPPPRAAPRTPSSRPTRSG